jgi:hypothetical protein
MNILLKAKFVYLAASGLTACLPGLASAAPTNLKQSSVAVTAATKSAFAPYLQLHYEAESMLMTGTRSTHPQAVQANLIGSPCLPENKGAKHG